MFLERFIQKHVVIYLKKPILFDILHNEIFSACIQAMYFNGLFKVGDVNDTCANNINLKFKNEKGCRFLEGAKKMIGLTQNINFIINAVENSTLKNDINDFKKNLKYAQQISNMLHGKY